jgi:protein-disulfide isomerase
MPNDESKPAPGGDAAERAVLLAAMLAWIGAAISLVLLQKHSGILALICPARGGCEAVLSSKFATIKGVPLAAFGAAFYLTALGGSLAAYASGTQSWRARLLGAVLWLAIVGSSFSAGLIFIQFAVLRAFCPLCTASALVVLLLALAAWRAERLAAVAEFAGRKSAALALACVALVASAIQAGSALSKGDVAVASVNGAVFTRSEMEAELGASLQSLKQSQYALEFDWVRKKIESALLEAEAQKRGVTVEQLAAPADPIEREKLIASIAANHRVEIFLRPPTVTAMRVDLTTAKLAGPREARVQLAVFSDFQCGFCAQLAPMVKSIREEFPNDVLVAFRYFPIEEHPRAMAAAVAAECAAEQDAFWQFHDQLFAEGGDLGDARLLALADALNLDRDRFSKCLASPRARGVVEASRKDAAESGLEGAPAVFLNGRRVSGALTYERLRNLVREELKK